MKLKDMMKEISPDDIREGDVVGVAGCPYEFDELTGHYNSEVLDKICSESDDEIQKCVKCWGMEYVENNKKITLIDKVVEVMGSEISIDKENGLPMNIDGSCNCPGVYIFLRGHFDEDKKDTICNGDGSCEECWNLEYIEDMATKPKPEESKEKTKTVGTREIEAEPEILAEPKTIEDKEELAPEPVDVVVSKPEMSAPKEPQKILDSGNRREFDSGAVRDVAEGKGRCDLLPLAEVYQFLLRQGLDLQELTYIRNFRIYSDVNCLYNAIDFMARRTNLIGIDAIIEVSKHFEDGCIKYGERNWEKGIPIHCYMDSGIRHLLKLMDGQTDERHDRAFIWNMLCAIWTMSNHPELDDFTDEGGANEL